jgi:hypothetical protein
MTDPTGDRVEAAARAMSFDSPVWDEYLTAAELALTAADECDRVAGVVRLDTRDEATFRLIRRACNDPGQFLPRGEQYDGEPNTLGHWQARAVLAALAAAGAPEETRD